MLYSTFIPKLKLQSLVECYWLVEGSDTERQKITPDGFTEFIFHYGDPYRVKHAGKREELQPLAIAAGQIEQPIFLQPTGQSGMMGIKFHPTGIWRLFGIEMSDLTNRTANLEDYLSEVVDVLTHLRSADTHLDRVSVVEDFLFKQMENGVHESEIDVVVNDIIESKGQQNIQALCEKYDVAPRKMERLFKQRVGVSAKMYSRIIRFANVFRLIQQPALSKAEATYLSGYFDQAHFNKEFKGFAGENPDAYFKENHAFANFFLNR